MNPSDSPRASFLIWLVPLVALAVSGWMLVRQFHDSGLLIEIEFGQGAGIEAGKTPLVYKGVKVGLVEDIVLKPGLDGVVVQVRLEPSARPLAVDGSDFWIIRPEIGLSGVKGIETLLSGARLGVRAGEGAPKTVFRGLPAAPVNEGLRPGRTFTLRAGELGSLHPGTAVYFRQVKVGRIEEHRLADDSTHVLVAFRIFAPYDQLVRTDTRFWNSGGLDVKVGLLGANVHSDSLESLVSGGVSFATPEESAAREPAPEGTVFALHDSAEKSWLHWAPKIPLPQAADSTN
jgi:paraquat-inducible protein B